MDFFAIIFSLLLLLIAGALNIVLRHSMPTTPIQLKDSAVRMNAIIITIIISRSLSISTLCIYFTCILNNMSDSMPLL